MKIKNLFRFLLVYFFLWILTESHALLSAENNGMVVVYTNNDDESGPHTSTALPGFAEFWQNLEESSPNGVSALDFIQGIYQLFLSKVVFVPDAAVERFNDGHGITQTRELTMGGFFPTPHWKELGVSEIYQETTHEITPDVLSHMFSLKIAPNSDVLASRTWSIQLRERLHKYGKMALTTDCLRLVGSSLITYCFIKLRQFNQQIWEKRAWLTSPAGNQSYVPGAEDSVPLTQKSIEAASPASETFTSLMLLLPGIVHSLVGFSLPALSSYKRKWRSYRIWYQRPQQILFKSQLPIAWFISTFSAIGFLFSGFAGLHIISWNDEWHDLGTVVADSYGTGSKTVSTYEQLLDQIDEIAATMESTVYLLFSFCGLFIAEIYVQTYYDSASTGSLELFGEWYSPDGSAILPTTDTIPVVVD